MAKNQLATPLWLHKDTPAEWWSWWSYLHDVAQKEMPRHADTSEGAVVAGPHLLADAHVRRRVTGDGADEAGPAERGEGVAVTLVRVVHQHSRHLTTPDILVLLLI
jgi:hypothetical protein